LAALHVAALEKAGIILVVGEVGSGKTMLARRFVETLPPHIHSVYLLNPAFSRDEILLKIAHDLGLIERFPRFERTSRASQITAIEQELLARHERGESTALVIDEAHCMPPETLDEIRLLTNIETARGKTLSIFLFAQPEIDEMLGQWRMRQLRDRVVYRFDLRGLSAPEVSGYLEMRTRIAGWDGDPLFTPDACSEVARASGGWPRAINKLADKSLLAAYAENARRIEPRHVRRACRDIKGKAGRRDVLPSWKMRPAVAVAWLALFLALGAATGLFLGLRDDGPARVAGSAVPSAKDGERSRPLALSYEISSLRNERRGEPE